jgi:hypothetical protein
MASISGEQITEWMRVASNWLPWQLPPDQLSLNPTCLLLSRKKPKQQQQDNHAKDQPDGITNQISANNVKDITRRHHRCLDQRTSY